MSTEVSAPIPSTEPIATNANQAMPPSTPSVTPEPPGVGPTGRGPALTSTSQTEKRGRGPLIAAVVGVVVVAAIAVGAFVLLGGDSDKTASTTTPRTEATSAGPEATAPAGPTTSPAPITDLSATITGIEVQDGDYAVDFTVDGFEPDIQGGPESHHLHFFFDTTEPENAGTNGDPPGSWAIYDGGTPFTLLSESMAQGASQICVVVATFEHEVYDAASGNCIDLPA
jgi:hypothetical protein